MSFPAGISGIQTNRVEDHSMPRANFGRSSMVGGSLSSNLIHNLGVENQQMQGNSRKVLGEVAPGGGGDGAVFLGKGSTKRSRGEKGFERAVKRKIDTTGSGEKEFQINQLFEENKVLMKIIGDNIGKEKLLSENVKHIAKFRENVISILTILNKMTGLMANMPPIPVNLSSICVVEPPRMEEKSEFKLI